MTMKKGTAERTFRQKAPWIMALLLRDFPIGLDDAVAILGNLGHESGGLASLQEISPTVKGSKGGYGWAQWTGPRRRAFMAWCEKKELPPASDEANYGFLVVELRGSEKGAIAGVRKAKTLEAKVKAFELGFERAGVKHYPSRNQWAAVALDAWNDAGGAPTLPAWALPAAPAKPKPKPAPAATRELLAMGTNDFDDPAEARDYISAAVQNAIARGRKPALVLPNPGNPKTAAISGVVSDVAREFGAEQYLPRLWASDALHPSARDYRALAQEFDGQPVRGDSFAVGVIGLMEHVSPLSWSKVGAGSLEIVRAIERIDGELLRAPAGKPADTRDGAGTVDGQPEPPTQPAPAPGSEGGEIVPVPVDVPGLDKPWGKMTTVWSAIVAFLMTVLATLKDVIAALRELPFWVQIGFVVVAGGVCLWIIRERLRYRRASRELKAALAPAAE